MFLKTILLLCLGLILIACEDNKDEMKNNFLFTGEEFVGEEIFTKKFTPYLGLGPHFNKQSCVECHNIPDIGGMGDANSMGFRIGTLTNNSFNDLAKGEGGPTARRHSVSKLGYECNDKALIPPKYATIVSLRSASSLRGLRDVESILDKDIEAEAIDKGYGIHGRVNYVKTTNNLTGIGKFGWKGHKASLNEFVGEAFRNELGITNTFAENDNFVSTNLSFKKCDGYSQSLEININSIKKVTNFIESLPIITQKPNSLNTNGYRLFKKVHCSKCHKPSYEVNGSELYLFSDLLIHDMGDGLNDRFIQGMAKGEDWRTAPLRELKTRVHFLHDGRTTNLKEAIREHRAEANVSKTMFFNLSDTEQKEIIEFLETL